MITANNAFAIARRYEALRRVVEDDDLPDAVQGPAEEEMHKLEGLILQVAAPCIICRGTFAHVATVQEVSTWTGAPRGLCGPCANGKEK